MAEPPEPAKCECDGRNYDTPCPAHNPPPPPEPAPDGPTLRANLAFWQGQMDALRAQLAAAQAEIALWKKATGRDDPEMLDMELGRDGFDTHFRLMIERADRAERERDEARAELLAWGGFNRAAEARKSVSEVLSDRLVAVERERDAAIKAKEEAETEVQVRDMQLDITIKERDAERKQVEFLNARISQLLDTAKREGMLLERDGFGRNERAVQAETQAGALRAALEVALEWLEGQALFQEVPNHSLMQRIRAALAAHSKVPK